MFTEKFFINKIKTIKRIAISLALLLFIFYLLYHFTKSFFFVTKTTDVVYSKLEVYENYTAYTFRDETVLLSRFGGAFDYHVRDGELVSPNTELVDCYENATEIDVNAKKKELLLKIDKLTKSNGKKNPNVGDIDTAKNNANRTYMEMLKSATQGDMSNAQIYSEEMLIELNKLSVYKDFSNNFNAEISQLKSELESLDAYFKGRYEPLTNKETGHFFYDVDGYESAFYTNIDGEYRADTFTVSEFYSLIEGMEKQEPPEGAYYAGKLVNDYNWFIGVPLTYEQSNGYFENKTYDINYKDLGQTIPMVLIHIIEDESSNKAVLIFEATDMPQGFSYPRSADITLLRKEYSGLLVPEGLILKIDGYTGVYVIEKLTVRFRKVNIIYKDYGYYIVSEYDTNEEIYYDYLEHNDAIITKGGKLYDGKVVG